jgi:hypothetical protein
VRNLKYQVLYVIPFSITSQTIRITMKISTKPERYPNGGFHEKQQEDLTVTKVNTDSEEEEIISMNPKPNNHYPSILSAKEKQTVRNVKFLVVAVLVVSIVGAIAIYLYIKNSEQTRFVATFDDDANKVLLSGR